MKEEMLLQYLMVNCAGRGNIRKSAQLQRSLGVGKNELCRLIHRLRVRGVPVGSSRDGYFYAVNAGEVFDTIRQLERMAAGLERSIRGLTSALEKFGPIERDRDE